MVLENSIQIINFDMSEWKKKVLILQKTLLNKIKYNIMKHINHKQLVFYIKQANDDELDF